MRRNLLLVLSMVFVVATAGLPAAGASANDPLIEDELLRLLKEGSPLGRFGAARRLGRCVGDDRVGHLGQLIRADRIRDDAPACQRVGRFAGCVLSIYCEGYADGRSFS